VSLISLIVDHDFPDVKNNTVGVQGFLVGMSDIIGLPILSADIGIKM